MDKGRRMQTDEFLRGIAVHRTRCGIGRDHATGLHIVDDQPIADTFKDALVMPFLAHIGL
jgi:hypothetical protein